MDLGFDHTLWLDGRRGERGAAGIAGDGAAPLDWHALRARLLAARASRRAVAAVQRAFPCATAASFHAAAARQLRGKDDCFTPVNPVSLTVRKTGLDNVPAIVGETRTGDRG